VSHIPILKRTQLKDLLETKYLRYNNPSFIEHDPISIPHRFSSKEDIEISGFLAATLSWGQRPVIIKNMSRLLSLMDNAPFDFITGFNQKDLIPFKNFVHRTFNGEDCTTFLRALKHIYEEFDCLEEAFLGKKINTRTDLNVPISRFRDQFLSISHDPRTRKHISDPMSGSACKRLNMFLRWMVRKDKSGVDFGIWKNISSSQLMLPLDVHSARVSRSLGLLTRKQNDWKAVEEVTKSLRKLDPADPVKYDFALFGMGVFEKF
jgi:uncharacterized protein (TIGR02757 family)